MRRWSGVLAAVTTVAMMVPLGGHAAGDPVRIDCYGFALSDLGGATAPPDATNPETGQPYTAADFSRSCTADETTAVDPETGNLLIVPVDVPAGYKASLLHTHGNFHSARTMGEMTVTWRDANGATVQSFHCAALAVSDDYDADFVGRAHCMDNGDYNPDYAPGRHSIAVQVDRAYNCPAAGPAPVRPHAGCYFHGRLYLVPSDSV